MPDDTANLLRRTNELLSLIAKALLSDVVERELSDDRMRRLYELTGQRSRDDLAKHLKMSATTVSKAWRRWEEIGLLIKDGNHYRRALD